MTAGGIDRREVRHFQVCCGSGGMGRGFNQAHARVGIMQAEMRCIGGVDVNATAIRDFTRFAGVQGTVLDLFSEDQYRRFHGRAPPVDWRPATALDLQRAAHGERPHIVAMSAPCKGFSGLLNPTAAQSPKYLALNGLTLRCVDLTVEAWADDPPELIIFENVPRIQQRGRELLDDIVHVLDMAGYAVSETTHDCGEIGDLAQHRKRFLLVARHRKKVPAFLYEPPKRTKLRGVGEVIGPLPMPDDPRGGPMHRCPRLHGLTWKRLALIPAGGDWRSLEGMDFGKYRIVRADWHSGILGVQRWEEPAGTVTTSGRPATGRFAVQDLRVTRPGGTARQNNVYRVVEWGGPSCSVTGGMGPSSGGLAVADPRGEGAMHGGGKYRITRMEEPAGAVIAESATGNGAFALADDRPPLGFNYRAYGVQPWEEPTGTLTGKGTASGVGSGVFSVADPRVDARGSAYGVVPWDEAAGTIIGCRAPGQGAHSVADPRWGGGGEGVIAWNELAGTVQGESYPSNGGFSVADPRVELPNMGLHAKMRVEAWDEPTHTITGSDRVGSGALSVQDVRVGSKDLDGPFLSAGHYGVVPWDQPTLAVTGSACHDNGAFSVADPRDLDDHERADPYPIIISLDGTWHRPFTGLELAVIQDYPAEVLMQEPMAGSETARREHIGNSVPPGTAAAIGSECAKTLLLTWAGVTFRLESTPIWVQPLVIALSIDIPSLGAA